MTSSSSININKRNVIWIFLIFIGFITSLLFLDYIDNNRKKEKFFDLIRTTKESEHISKLIFLTKKYNEQDSLSYKLIKEELISMKKNIDKLYSCELLIPINDSIYRIGSYNNSNLIVKKSLWDKEKKVIEYLNDESQEKIFDLNKNDQPIWSIIKLDSSYLIIKRYLYN